MGVRSTLLIKHLPSQLNISEREEILRIVGAIAIRVLPDDGKMKFSAFATFKDDEDAKRALSILHQREILGQVLIVEYAKEKHLKLIPHLTDHHKDVHSDPKGGSANSSEKNILKHDSERFSKSLHGIGPALGLDYLPSPLLKYKYPLPTSPIIQNICHALVAVPKFYTQVLHLMNKMNLPAPFGPVTPAPPLALDVNTDFENSSQAPCDIDVLNTEDMVVTSEEESEYESESEVGEKTTVEKVLPVKRPSKPPKKKLKKPKLIVPLPSTGLSKPRTEPSEVFESQPIAHKKICVKKIDQITPADSITENFETVGGFGAFDAPKEIKDNDINKESRNEDWHNSQFISLEELKKKKISSREMKTMSIFRNYSAGEPTFRLYIKNLARQVEEKDLQYIFGRYIDNTSENDKNMFDIRLMKEGRMKGQGFITLANENQAIRAVNETNGFVLHTKPMVVQFARSAKPKDDDKKPPKS